MTRAEMAEWIVAALSALGGRQHFVRIAQWIWNNQEKDLRAMGDYFFIWQFEMRWAEDLLVRTGRMTKDDGERGYWGLRGATK
jgi:hypothetical protein